MSWNLFAPCPRGLEAALADELRGLGAGQCRPVAGGVAFTGDRATAYRANLWSRLASRVLREVGRRRYRDADDLYRLGLSIDWETFFDARHTLRVDTSATRSPLRSLNFATLRLKDAIVDRLRERTGERPSIDTQRPDARVWLFLEAQEATAYLDLSGEPLFKRGWRSVRDDGGDAPLKENLAAGLLTLAGWERSQALADLFCGSGTIVIEAACQACDVAPGLSRGFGFERLLDHEPALWNALRDEAAARAQAGIRLASEVGEAPPLRLTGTDIDPQAVARARRNQARAGLPDGLIHWQVGNAAQAAPPCEPPGLVISNPPYGERLDTLAAASEPTPGRHAASRPALPTADDGHAAAMQAVGSGLRERWAGWRIWLLTADPELPRQLGMKESRRTPLFNGALECRFFRFDVFAPGSRPLREPRATNAEPPATAPASAGAIAGPTLPAAPSPPGRPRRRKA